MSSTSRTASPMVLDQRQNVAYMAFAEDYDVIDAFPPD
jgi:hypothetical protein